MVALLAALGGGYFFYQSSLAAGGRQIHPQEQIDVVDIKSNLLSIGQAERMYLAAHGSYGTLEQLQQDGSPSLGTPNRGYAFSVDTDGARGFTATATPTDSTKTGWPALAMTETMEVTTKPVPGP
jgi:hypothetical protein